MKTLDKYVLKEFFAPLGLVVIGAASLICLVEIVDSLSRYQQWGASAELIVLRQLTRFPYLVTEVLPLGVLLASLLSLGTLARNSELTAARAGGVSGARIALPILAAAFAISLLNFVGSELLVTKSTNYSQYIQRVLIEKRDLDLDRPWRSDMAKSLSDDRQLYCKDYDSDSGVMREVIIVTRADNRIAGRIDAVSMKFDSKNGWILFDGVERVFDPAGEEKALRNFQQWPASISELPKDFMVDSDKREVDLMEFSMKKLWGIIAVLKKTGADYRKEMICLHLRVSYPFACFVIALLGVSIPFLFPSGKRAMTGAALGFLVSLVCGVIYLVFIQVGLSLGKSGYLPMLLSAWLSNLVFLVVGCAALWKVNR
jgi:lipopolysaccharide export system permease protein